MFAAIVEINMRPGHTAGWHREAGIIPDYGMFARTGAPQYFRPPPRP